MRIALKNVLIIFGSACITVSRKPCLSIEVKRKSSKFSYSVAFVERTLKFLSVLTPPFIYNN